jgi:hypothetical protein
MLSCTFPQWKVAKIILHLKPGKPPQRTYVLQADKPTRSSTYTASSQLLKIAVTTRPSVWLSPATFYNTPNSPYSAQNHLHLHNALETKQYCSAAYLDISQAFHRVWHTGLLHKLRQFNPLNYYLILKSYQHNRHFQVKVEDSYTDLLPVNAGVPQGSVLGPLLYLLYTADLATSPDSTIATFADDTAILAIDPDPAIASQKLQTSLLAIQHWLTK